MDKKKLNILLLIFIGIALAKQDSGTFDSIEKGYETVMPLNLNKIIGSILLCALIILAVIGGLGGGTICVHILLLFFKMDVTHSAAISNTVITISALVQYLCFYLNQKHPTIDGPITDYNIAVLLLPMTLFGAKCGLLAYRLLSAPMLLLILTVVTIVFSVLTIMKGAKLVQKKSIPPPLPNPRPLPIPQHDNREIIQYGSVPTTSPISQPMFPLNKVLYSIFIMMVILVADLMQGTKYTPSILGIKTCSIAFWAIFVIVFSLSVCFTWFSYQLVKLDRSEQNINLDMKGLMKICFIAFICGFLLSSTGLGGGMTLNPLLLQIGVLPEVTAATTVFTLCITTFASSILLTLHGYMLMGYFILFNVISIFATIAARFGVKFLCRDRNQLQAGIIICVGAILVLTAILIPIVIITRGTTIAEIISFKNICGEI